MIFQTRFVLKYSIKSEFSSIYNKMKNKEKRVNPFTNDPFSDMNLYDKIYFIIASFTITPIRCVLVIITMLILWASSKIVLFGRTKEDTSRKPLDGWRLLLKPIPVFLSRLLFFFGGFHWISIYGQEDRNAKVVAVAPHSSFFDAIGFVGMNFPSVLGRAGSDEVPFFGNLLNLAQSIMVNRESQTSRAETVKKINERLNSPLAWPRLGIFVEGTCSNRKALLEFKPGAFIPGLPVQPVCFKYPNRIDSVSWCWKGPSFWWLLWLTLSQLHNRFEIHYLPIYYPNEEEKKNPILFANNVRGLMAKYLDVPVADYSYEDFLLMSKFQKSNIPYEIDQVNVNKIRRQLGVSTDAIFEMVKIYAQLCNMETGLCDLNSFQNYIQIKSLKLSKYFNIFDASLNGSFNFRQFLVTYFEVIDKELNSNQEKTQETIEDLIKNLQSDNKTHSLGERIENVLKVELVNLEHDSINDLKSQITNKPLFGYFLLGLFTQKF